MTLIGSLRARAYAGEIRARASAYAEDCSRKERDTEQLESLNREWRHVLGAVPYYADLRREFRLPAEFGTLDEFRERVPITTRRDVQEHLRRMTDAGAKPTAIRMTGGSTATPIQIPARTDEGRMAQYDMWVGRSWYGLTPASRLFLLWGHSHLLGTGLAGWLRGRRRALNDRLVGYERFSAYDLSPEAMRRAGDALLRARPDYVVGYSVALDLFASANADRAAQLRELGLKAVLGTAEAFPSPDSAARLGDIFGCPVGMEYGAVEVGVMGHTHPAGGYRVFWRSHLVEALGKGPSHRVVVTSLYRRAFPLVRYDIGDEVELVGDVAPPVGLEAFERVIGRCNDYVRLRNGRMIHSELFSHAVRPCSAVRGYQVVQDGGTTTVRLAVNGAFSEADVAEIRRRLTKIDPELEAVGFERVEHLEQTVAGKTRMVVRR